MSDLKLVIFDCDGTLIDSQHFVVEAMSMAFRANGIEMLSREQVLSGVGLSLPLAIERLLPNEPRKVIEAVSDGYREAARALRAAPVSHEPLYDGIADVIDALTHREDAVLGIATGKSIRGVDRLLAHMSWEGRFVTIQTADTNASKPHPEMIETAMREAAIGPENTIMIGDTTFDMRMARNAGVAALGVSWGYHPVAELHKQGAHDVAQTAAELIPLADQLLRRPAG
ncbi:MAG: HAD-IA family hydrolase [Hyphomicrobiaceae bacterium]